MRRHIAALATAATLSLWPFAVCAQQEAQVQGLLNRILRMQAEDAAAKIGQFIHEIEVQMDLITAQSPSSGAAVPPAAMTATHRRTKSAANSGRKSLCGQRNSITTFV